MEIRRNPLLWLLAFVPVVFATAKPKHEAHTLIFVLPVLAIVPLAALLSHATESVASRTGDAVGGLLNAALGNLTELVIPLTALRAGQYMLVKAPMAGVIVTNTLFRLVVSFLLGGLKHHVQEYIRVSARVQAESSPPNLVILDLSAAPYVDLLSVHTQAGLAGPWAPTSRLSRRAPACAKACGVRRRRNASARLMALPP